MKRWNVYTKQYEDYSIPEEWTCKTYANDMAEKVNCAQCGKVITFGESYTSLEVHTNRGFGYSVCEDCYSREVERRKHERAD